ncbi:hypothetical protein CLV62_10676 [Dysgonomonas alginatilytica]|uniref:Zinc ribbon protein n=1 Tax=Dysgonomonas alginatilytica TaxID=1605892 RepID=A0A2V3PSZ9_9BACT|nr:hypothetical protein [Dysgonomonas alginatilytica]PXV65903.1 hypothetical protein CLV62_10676 [Dysgonomonas alginatilytica]
MSDSKQCPFCGKPITENENICEECKDHMDHQYATDFLDEDDIDNSPKDELQVENDESTEPVSQVEDEPLEEVVSASAEPVKARSKISKGILFIILGSAILVVIGIIGALNIAHTRESDERQEMFWMQCVEENTPLSYSKYLVRYPEGNFVEEAEKRIRTAREAEVQTWEKLRKSSDINAFYAYLSENPKTPHIDQIRIIMDSLSWSTTLKDNTADAYKAYLENIDLGNITGAHKDEAKEKYDYLSQIVVLSGTSLESLKIDLVDFFKKLSENKPKNLLKEFAPKTFYLTGEMSSTEVVSSIAKEYSDKKIKKITYNLLPESLSAKQDNKGIVFVELTVEKEIVYDIKKKKNDKLKQNLLLEINSDKLIRSMKVKGNR